VSEPHIVNVYRNRPLPGRIYYVREVGTGICCQHEDPVLALKDFDSIWAGRSPYQLIEHAPPQMKSPGSAAPQTDQIIEHESAFRKSLLRHFHSDLIGSTRRFSADQVVSAINDAWESTRPK
jgi:hypothetical protein